MYDMVHVCLGKNLRILTNFITDMNERNNYDKHDKVYNALTTYFSNLLILIKVRYLQNVN